MFIIRISGGLFYYKAIVYVCLARFIMSMDPAHLGPASDNKRWRAHEGLNLEKPIAKDVKSPLSERLSGLDLASTSQDTPVLAIARRMDQYANSTAHGVKGPLFPKWANSMPQYGDRNITDCSCNTMSCELMESLLQEDISNVRQGVDYNGLHVVNEFITFCETMRTVEPGINPVEIFHRFQPDSRNEAALKAGTTCVGKAWDIVKRLEERSVVAYVVVESAGPDQPPTHAAVVVPCTNGLLLIDVDKDIPILTIKPHQPFIKTYLGKGTLENPDPQHPHLTLSFEIVAVPGNYNTQVPLIAKRETFTSETQTKKNSYSQFVLRPDTNPDDSVMKRWLVSSHTWFYPVASATRSGQEQHSIQVNVAQEKITFSIGNKKFRIPLDAFDPKTGRVDREGLLGDPKLELTKEQLEGYRDLILGKAGTPEVGGPFFDAFNTPKNLLIDQIFNVIAHKDTLKELREG